MRVVVVLLALAGCGEAQPTTVPGGDPARGRALFVDYGCGACHAIGGQYGARGVAGPALDDFARRSFVAGQFANAPRHLIPWLIDPPAMVPTTAMPDMDVTPADARHLAAYLYTLGAEGADSYPTEPPPDRPWAEEPPLP